MPGLDGRGPSYISAHSADVILSDIRPIKLKPEALQAINVLLDEFLSRILNASGSLATDKLRAGLLSLLPTSLGKEALLEAEVELRAYWDRTDTKDVVEDDNRTFHFQWSFSLLRLKCEAYSTLNEEDEDPASERRINEMFGKVHPHAPRTALLDPAALYLTAILESMCEHILSNVGRVAARDSSRTNATANDLFVALCEDVSIYGLFRAMKVYEHIESLSKTPKSRRSKSFTQNDRSSSSRTSSPQHELTPVNSSGSRSRQSSDGPAVTPLLSSTSGSRASFDKSRAIRMFNNNKGPGDGETQSGHKKSASIRSENFPDEDPPNPGEDAAMLREFDNLMRSTSTMKVSLTPDRLKTMEVYKQEKDLRSTSRRPGSGLPPNPDIVPSNSQRPSLRHIDFIIDEEDQNYLKGRARQASVTTPPSPSLIGIVPTRSRSVSTSSGVHSPPARQLSRKTSVQAAPSSFPSVVDMVQSRIPKTHDNNGFPPRTRIRQRNRDSMDLDDVMNGSDDDPEDVPVHQQPRSPPTPRRVNPPHAVSASTRDLMDFLAEGPPELPVSKHGKELVDFLANGPPDEMPKSKPVGGGRLQRMISKLNLGNGEKPKGMENSRIQSTKQPTAPIYPTKDLKFQSGTLSSLANKPIPPRPPRPISPHSSPHSSPSQDSSDENKSVRSAARKPYQDGSFSREPTPAETQATEKPVPMSRVLPTTNTQENIFHHATPNHVKGTLDAKNDRVVPAQATGTDVLPIVPSRTVSSPISSPLRKSVPVESTSTPSIPINDIRDMQRLLSSATTADECRLIFEMFMARNGIPKDPRVQTVAYPSPSVVNPMSYTGVESLLESSLVELFLGGSASSVVSSQTSAVQLQLESQVNGSAPEKSTGVASDTQSPAVPIKTFPVSAAPITV